MSAFQRQFSETTESLEKRIRQSQITTNQLTRESQNAIFAQMGELVKVIQAIGAHLPDWNNIRQDQQMKEPKHITPVTECRPEFETTGTDTKKPKANTDKFIGNGAIQEMITLLKQSQKQLPERPLSPARDEQWESAKNTPSHLDENNTVNKTQHTEQSAHALIHSWR